VTCCGDVVLDVVKGVGSEKNVCHGSLAGWKKQMLWSWVYGKLALAGVEERKFYYCLELVYA
jgi:hypothetical protein